MDLNAISHKHTLDALQRFRVETLDQPVGDVGVNLLQEDGDALLTEDSDNLTSDGTSNLKLTYKISASPHNYDLDALKRV